MSFNGLLPSRPDRRRMIAAALATLATAALAPLRAFADGAKRLADTAHRYEILRSEDDWRALLDDDDFSVLREGKTLMPDKTTGLWNESRPGIYACGGCDLSLFEARNRVPVDMGFVFFKNAIHDAVLTGVDQPQPAYGQDPNMFITLIEVHCRRCASHVGHILLVEGDALYCIEQHALNFHPSSA